MAAVPPSLSGRSGIAGSARLFLHIRAPWRPPLEQTITIVRSCSGRRSATASSMRRSTATLVRADCPRPARRCWILAAGATATSPSAESAARFAHNGDPTPMTELSLALVAERDGQPAGLGPGQLPGEQIRRDWIQHDTAVADACTPDPRAPAKPSRSRCGERRSPWMQADARAARSNLVQDPYDASPFTPGQVPLQPAFIRTLYWTQIGPNTLPFSAVNGRDLQRSTGTGSILQGHAHQPPHTRRSKLMGGQTRDYAAQVESEVPDTGPAQRRFPHDARTRRPELYLFVQRDRRTPGDLRFAARHGSVMHNAY